MTCDAQYDLIVIGGGPAGTAAAITAARRGANVLMLEAGAFPRHKVCGEFVSPEALATLRTLLSPAGFAALTQDAPRIRDIRLLRNGLPEATIPFPEAAQSIPRYDLDAALWNAALDAGVTCHDRMRADAMSHEAALWEITCGDTRFRSTHLLLATGRWSNLPRRQPPPKASLWVGLKAQFYETNPAQSCDLYFFPGGYCGVQPVGDDCVNVAAMVRSDVAKSLPETFVRHAALALRALQWTPVFAPLSCAPLVHGEPATSLDGALLAGDAAGFVDPFVGDGISLALHSGCLAAQAIFYTPECAAEVYAESYQRALAPAFRNAARLRRLTGAPSLIQRLALGALRIPPVQKRVIAATRVR